MLLPGQSRESDYGRQLVNTTTPPASCCNFTMFTGMFSTSKSWTNLTLYTLLEFSNESKIKLPCEFENFSRIICA